MTIVPDTLAQQFTDTLCTGPQAGIYAKICDVEHVLQAGEQLQALAHSLTPLVPQGIAISDQGLQQLVTSYVEHYPYLAKGQESLTAWCVTQLLTHGASLTAAQAHHLAQEIETVAQAAHDVAQQRAASLGTPARSWCARHAQVPASHAPAVVSQG